MIFVIAAGVRFDFRILTGRVPTASLAHLRHYCFTAGILLRRLMNISSIILFALFPDFQLGHFHIFRL
jgi:hypothetical protein